MVSLAITLAIFLVWGIVGYALTSCLLSRRQAISNLLLAPAVGMGTLELAAHIGLRFGSPVGPLARPIVLGALLLAAIVLLVRRPAFPVRRVLPFGLIFLAAIPLSGWPLLKWGGDWICHANEDMANYCLAATGYRDHGFRTLMLDPYFVGEDLSYEMWSLFTDRCGTRHGCEMSLAMTSEIASLPVPLIFMHVILAMHLTLISAVGFMLHRLGKGQLAATLACAFMAISPLSTFGVIQQLIAQVGGLALLIVNVALFCRPARRLSAYGFLKRGILGGIVSAALVLHYTESVSFLVAAFGLHTAVGFARRRRDFKQILITLLSAVVVALLLGNYLVANIAFLSYQTRTTVNRPALDREFFPQYLSYEGLARLWGLETIHEPAAVGPQPQLPVHRVVLAGGLCLLLCLGAGISLAWRRRPVGTMLLVMAGVGAFFVRTHTAFGLFKLAMYAQPFIVGSIVLGWARMNPGRWKWAGLICLIALVPLQFSTQRKYVSFSATGEYSEFPSGATKEQLLTQFWNGFHTTGGKRFVVPMNDGFSWRVLAGFGRGLSLCFPAKEPSLLAHPLEINNGPLRPTWTDLLSIGTRGINEGVQKYSAGKGTASIALLDPAKPEAVSKFEWDTPTWLDRPQPGDYLLEPPERYSLFNRHHRSSESRESRAVQLGDVKNFIIWRPSSLSKAFNPIQGNFSGLYQLQADPLFPQDTMASSGQYLTFQVLNPDRKVRVLVAGTTTYVPGDHELLAAAAVGDRRVSLPLIGQGSARVVSEPISLQSVGASNYLLLDLARPVPPATNGDPTVAQDHRQISLYLRDVSLLSEEDYAALVPPQSIKAFPADLARKNLEFSGCIEDGTVGKHSWFRLGQPRNPASLVVRGRLFKKEPNGKEANQLFVKWKGVEVGRKTIEAGEFEFRIEIPGGVGPGKLELEFSESPLVPQLNCHVCAQLTFVGFEP
ncbi:MAG TPA: hypothetical protein VG097_00970 [Gemmata sp.]|jgi:hypothetical protein|nr:hypothetical protein [Gemmata sp.]